MGFAMRYRGQERSRGPPAAIGIDLGTAYSRVGVWRDGDVVIIPDARGKLSTPSCVAFTSGGVLVGDDAVEQAQENLANTFFAPQRLIGAKFGNPWLQWHLKSFPTRVVRCEADGSPLLCVAVRGVEKRLRPEEVVTILIDNLRQTAEHYLGETATQAVVTVPAQLGRRQREALIGACRAARLKVLSLIKAPSAAGIAFCLTNPCQGRRHILICDVGASYFDFTLMTVEDWRLVERAVGTDTIDLDASLIRFCLQDLKERFNTTLPAGPELQPVLWRLRSGCEAAKRTLSQWNQARVDVPGIADGLDYSVMVSRGHFEDFARLDIESLLDPIDFCLEDCGLGRADVDVVLVGGAARVPRVRRAFREFFYGQPAHQVQRPDHGAILGAVVYAAALSSSGDCTDAERGAAIHRIRLEQVSPWVEVSDSTELPSPRCDADERRAVALVAGPPPPPPPDDLPDSGVESNAAPSSRSSPVDSPRWSSASSASAPWSPGEVPHNEAIELPMRSWSVTSSRSASGHRFL